MQAYRTRTVTNTTKYLSCLGSVIQSACDVIMYYINTPECHIN